MISKWLKKRRSQWKHLIEMILICALVLASACGKVENTVSSATSEKETSSMQAVETDTSITSSSEKTSESSATTETSITETSTTESVETETPSQEPSVSETIETESPSTESTTDVSGGVLEVYFIDVGQGDASLLCCDGHYMLIDGGPPDSSDVIFAFLREHDIAKLDYIVATHPDADHIGGLAAALEASEVGRAFCPVLEYDNYSFQAFSDRLVRQQVELETPSCGMVFELGSAHCTVIGPTEESEKTNNNSIVIRVAFGNTSFLFTGDAEGVEEDSILKSGCGVASDVLKVSHHGSEYATTDAWLEEVKPSIAVISCGMENSYGFPTAPVLKRLQQRGVTLYRTDLQGDILIRSDGERLEVTTEKNTDQDVFTEPILEPSVPDDGLDHDYVINVRTGKFHNPDCDAVSKMDEKNKQEYHGTRNSLIEEGYAPCKMCAP